MRRPRHLAVLSLVLVGPVLGAPGAAAGPAGGTLAWAACADAALAGYECATLTVPRDRADAAAGTIDLAVLRAPATGDPDERIGSLFFNPGGPGMPSVDLAPQVVGVLPEAIRRHYDFVTWDPRGVGRSSGLTGCEGGSYHLPDTGPVDWAAVLDEMRRSQAAANADCEARHPDVVPYLSTRATVADLDELRAAVGDERLTYWGTSYGTRIGFVYAHDFPGRTRAMVLTSPVDPDATWERFALGSAVSPDNALGLLFEVETGTREAFDRAAATLETTTLTLPSGRPFTRWSLRVLPYLSAFSEGSWGMVGAFIRAADAALHGTGAARDAALATLDELAMPIDAIPINGGATPFIGCSDYADRLTPARQDELAALIRAEAPIGGWAASQALVYCEGMTIEPDPVPVAFTDANTPLLVVGSTRDGLTLHQWATDLGRMFATSRVITYVGGAHTPFPGTSPCIDGPVVAFLVDGALPATDLACPRTDAAG